ncbi:MAG: hypothetical protein ACYC56_15075, partial [Candidatus Aquicultor sp.]
TMIFNWVNPLNETAMDIYATTAGSTTLGLVASGVTGTSYTYTGSVAPGAAAPTVATSNAIQAVDNIAPAGAAYQPSMSGSRKRSLVKRLSQNASIFDFDVDPTGSNDSTAGYQQAINQVQGTKFHLDIPAGFFSVNTLAVTAPINMTGQGSNFSGNTSNPNGSNGSFLNIFGTGSGITVSSAANGSIFDGFATIRNQPAYSQSNWAANDLGYDFQISGATDIYMRNLFLVNPTRGIQSIGGGRINIIGVRMDPFINGIYIDDSKDTDIIGNLHAWPFWDGTTADVMAYAAANLDVINLFRCDNPQFYNLFTYGARSAIRVSQSSYGTTSKLHLSTGDFDIGGYGLWVDNTVTDGFTGQLETVTTQGWGALPDQPAIQIDGSNCSIEIGTMAAAGYQTSVVAITASNNSLSIGNPKFSSLNLSGAASPVVVDNSGSGNSIYLGGPASNIPGFTIDQLGASVTAPYTIIGNYSGQLRLSADVTLPITAYGQAIQVVSGVTVTLPLSSLAGQVLHFYGNNYTISTGPHQFIYAPKIGLNSTTPPTTLNVVSGDVIIIGRGGGEFDVLGGEVVSEQSIYPPTNALSSKIVIGSTTTAGNITATAAQLAGQYLADGATQTAVFTVTTDTAVNILAAMPNAVVGTAFKWRFINNDQSATGYAGTLAGGTGVTVGTILPNPAVPKGGYEDYVFTFTAIGTAPTLTVEAVGGSSAALL